MLLFRLKKKKASPLRYLNQKSDAHSYLRKAADEAVVSTGAVFSVQAVVEEVGVAESHTVQTDVELDLDAAPQVVAATGELNGGEGGIIKNIPCFL